MITGDNLLTAVAVANKLDFGPHTSLTLHSSDGKTFSWVDHDEKSSEANITNDSLREISKKHSLCLIGPTID